MNLTTMPGSRRVTRTTSSVARVYAATIVKLRFVVIAVWVMVAVLAATHLPLFGSANGPMVQLIPTDSPALRALENSVRWFRIPAGSEFAVVQYNPDGLSPSAQASIVRQAVRADRAPDGGALRFALPIINTAKLFPASRQSGTTSVTFLYFDEALPAATQNDLAAAYARRAATESGSVVGVTGAIPGQLSQGTIIDQNLNRVEIATLVLIAAIILLAYRSIGSPLVALAGIAVGFPVTVWALGQLNDRYGLGVPQELDPVVIALLLGILTDYTIFFLSGVRGRLSKGDDRLTATRTTTAEFTPIIVTSAVILSCGLLALLVSTLGFFRDLGPALALTVGVGLVVSITLIPALIATFGGLVFWPRTPVVDESEQLAAPTARVTGRLLARRWIAFPTAALCLAALCLAASQLQSLNLGFGQISDLPATSAPKVAAHAATRGFGPGILQPTSVLIQAPGVASTHRSRLEQMQQLIGEQPGVAATIGPREQPTQARLGVFYAPSADAARIVVIFKHDPLGASGIEDLNHLQSAMPQIARQTGLTDTRISYAGDTALADDTVSDIYKNMVRVAAVVLIVNLLLLIVFLRSLIAPLFLLGSSAIAVAASLGLTTWIFQSWLGYGQLTYYVPFVVSVLLISLGSDYNIFVVGRIWQEASLRPLREAIAIAAPEASRAIRAAGITLAASFAIIAIIPIRSFREIAFAMVTGILIETFVVRSLLAPSLITIFGYVSGWPGRRLHAGVDLPIDPVGSE